MIEAPVKKNNNYNITIQDVGDEGEGIGKIEGFTVFVEGGVVGDELEIRIVKEKKSYAYGKIINIIKPSEYRVTPKCEKANVCGGCNLQHYTYEAQLEYKTKKVKDAIERIGNQKDVQVNDIIGMENPYHYRNKAQYPVAKGKDDEVMMGFFKPRTHHVINIENCFIQDEIHQQVIEKIRTYIKENDVLPYNEINHTGLIRHVLVRNGFTTKEIMVCIIINGKKIPNQSGLISLLTEIENVTSISLNYNKSRTNVILGNKTEVIWGNPYITDYIGEIKFKISPQSFFQVNPRQTVKLYNKVMEYADLTGEETVIDTYCGIGSISLFLAKKAKKVYGIEVVEEAVEDAIENAALNHIENAEFVLGRAEEKIKDLIIEKNITPDVVVIDPPRRGCDKEFIDMLNEVLPNKIIYVSCNPATLARDLSLLCEENYKVKAVQPVDMFAQVNHVETIVLLQRQTI